MCDGGEKVWFGDFSLRVYSRNLNKEQILEQGLSGNTEALLNWELRSHTAASDWPGAGLDLGNVSGSV